ncbi:MAG: hypothetical protein JW936_01055 [Sedimentisphaerales bacterium]|nr:hypothetical protein [Sedimentisphaerales bacterium]
MLKGVFKLDRILVLCGIAFCLACWTGCDDGEETGSGAVNESGRLILSSNQEIILNESEFERSAETAGPRGGVGDDALSGGQTRVAQQVMERHTREADFDALQAELEAIGAVDQQSLGQLRELSQRLAAACNQMATAQDQADNVTAVEAADRLRRAESILNQALSGASREQQAGPKLMLGTLHKMQASSVSVEVLQAAIASESVQQELSSLISTLSRRATSATEVAGYPPSEAITLLERWLQGDGDYEGLEQQLEQAQSAVQELDQERQRLQREADEYQVEFTQLNQQYHSTLQQAEETRGQERFDLSEQAYALRVGDVGNPEDATSGASYYEAQYELASSNLAIVQEQLEHALLRRDRLAESIRNLEQRLQSLRGSSMFALSADRVDSINSERTDLLARLREVLNTDIRAGENAYRILRVDAVNLYTQAIDDFNGAARVSRGNTKDYAETLAISAQTALSDLWMADALHYDTMSTILAIAESIPEVADTVASMQQEFSEQAELAREAAYAIGSGE